MKVLKALAYAVFVFIIWNLIQGIGMFIYTVVMTIRYIDDHGIFDVDLTQESLLSNPEFSRMIGDIMSKFPVIYILTTIVTLLVVMITFAIRKDKFKGYVRFVRIKWISRDSLMILILGVFLNMITTGVIYTFFLVSFEETNNIMDVIFSNLSGDMFVWLIIMMVIVAPFFEEIIFRGIILNDFRKATRLWVAITIQALAFGIFHMNLMQGVYATILGLVLGLVYLKYRSIWFPILLHFSFNATALLIAYLVKPEQSQLSAMILIVLGIVGTVLVTFRLWKDYKSKEYPETYIPYEILLSVKKFAEKTTMKQWFYGEEADDNVYSGHSDIY